MEYEKGNGNLPSIYVRGNNIPEAWEKSVLELYDKGLWYQRGGRKDKDKLQTDSTMTIEIENPLSDYFMHRGMNCGWTDLFEYEMEILGAKDSWVDSSGKIGRWPYSYHQRFTDYPGINGMINQINDTIDKIVQKPSSRQHNMITWFPEYDNNSEDPPCLQRIWFGLIPDEKSSNESYVFNMNYNFRSRNIMTASPMNMIGLSFLQYYILDEIKQKSDLEIEIGRMIEFNDSYHVSSKDQHLFTKFVDYFGSDINKEKSIEEKCFTRKKVFDMMEKRNSWKKLEDKILFQTKKFLTEEEFKIEKEKILNIFNYVRDTNKKLCENA